MQKSTIRIAVITVSLVLFCIIIVISALFVIKPFKQTTQPVMDRLSSQSKDKKVPSRKLVMSDEFNGTSLDTAKWNTCYDSYSVKYKGCTNFGNFEYEWYTAPQVSVSGGNLVLTTEKKTTKGVTAQGYEYDYPYTSGMVTSGRYIADSPPKWSRTYGYYEARMNVPFGQAVWPAFWLLPVDRTWPPEIDVMELLGDKPSQILTTYHWKGPDNQGQPKDSSIYDAGSSVAGAWHTYGVDWQPGRISWYFDGKLIKQAEGENVPTKDMQIIFNVAVGGTLPGKPDETTPNKTKMLVDYIRVYE